MLAKTVGTVRYCYNWGLAKWMEMYEHGEKCDQYFLSRLWTKEKPEWAKETYRNAQTQALLNLGGAFKAFFEKRHGHPTPHKRGRKDSFCVDNIKGKITKNNKLHLPNIGNVRMAEKLRFEGKIRRYQVSRKADQWFVSIYVEIPDPLVAKTVKSPVGVDVGSKHWAITSDGSLLDRPASIPRLMKRLKHYQRMVSRRQKDSKNKLKAKIKTARKYKRVHDIKLDAVHKFTSQLVKSHDLVCCESLIIANMVKGQKPMRRAVYNSCMGELRRQLSYKAAHYIEVAWNFPSSKRCSNCGHVKETLALDDRTYKCSSCGVVLDRDFNASVNLMKEGLRVYTEGHSGSACGERRSA